MPKLLYRKCHLALNKILDASKRWINSGWEKFDEKDKDSDWEKHFGSKYIQELVFMLSAVGVSHRGQASTMLSLIWALGPPRDTAATRLLQLVREVSAIAVSNSDGNVSLNVPRLVSDCLLTSIYLECLRTRNSATVTRKVVEDLECDGYMLKKGSHIMCPSWVPAHHELWDVPGHLGKPFWPERFIEMPKFKAAIPDEKSQFELAMKPDYFFPYGGGGMICSGRFFAKQEIMAAIALLVLNFDIEGKGWVTLDGNKSQRAALPNESTAGAGLLKPDQDLMVKMMRIE